MSSVTLAAAENLIPVDLPVDLSQKIIQIIFSLEKDVVCQVKVNNSTCRLGNFNFRCYREHLRSYSLEKSHLIPNWRIVLLYKLPLQEESPFPKFAIIQEHREARSGLACEDSIVYFITDPFNKDVFQALSSMEKDQLLHMRIL